MKYFTRMLYALFLILWCSMSNATCTYSNNFTPKNINQNLGSFSLQRDAPTGTTITDINISSGWDANTYLAYCSSASTGLWTLQNGILASGFPHTYNTNVNGVGIKVLSGLNNNDDHYYDNPPRADQWGGEGSWHGNWAMGFEVTLIKTGPITSGGDIGSFIAQFTLEDQNGALTPFTLHVTGGQVNLLACSIDTPELNISMGDHFTTEFTEVGHVTEETKVPIKLNCNSGARINAVITANEDSSTSQQGVIKLNDGGASGIAVQFLDKNDNGLKLNQNFVVDTTTNDGEYDFNWTARYLQTQKVVTTGDANALATLTLTYE